MSQALKVPHSHIQVLLLRSSGRLRCSPSIPVGLKLGDSGRLRAALASCSRIRVGCWLLCSGLEFPSGVLIGRRTDLRVRSSLWREAAAA